MSEKNPHAMALGSLGAALEAAVAAASAALRSFPKGPTGMTPDVIKASPEWRSARRDYSDAFEKLRAFNAARLRRDR
jgi:hypothetical protein